MTKMKTHWVADIFPLNKEDVDRLAEDIKASGQKVPILTLDDGTIVDGRTRFLACEKAGVKPVVEVIENGNDDELLKLSWSLNESRRHLSTSQRACAAAEVIERLPEEAKGKGGKRGNQHKSGNADNSVGKILAQFAAGKEIVRQARTLLVEAPGIFKECKEGRTYVARAFGIHDRSKREAKKLARKDDIGKEDLELMRAVDEGQVTADEAEKQLAERKAEETERKRKLGDLLVAVRMATRGYIQVGENTDEDLVACFDGEHDWQIERDLNELRDAAAFLARWMELVTNIGKERNGQ